VEVCRTLCREEFACSIMFINVERLACQSSHVQRWYAVCMKDIACQQRVSLEATAREQSDVAAAARGFPRTAIAVFASSAQESETRICNHGCTVEAVFYSCSPRFRFRSYYSGSISTQSQNADSDLGCFLKCRQKSTLDSCQTCESQADPSYSACTQCVCVRSVQA